MRNEISEEELNMCKKIVSLVLCLVLLCTVLPMTAHAAELPFKDVPKNWAYDGISYCYNNGLMSGVSATEFRPNEPCTRAMVVSVLYRMAGSPYVKHYNNPFTDVKAGWYYDAVVWAANWGIVSGTSKTTFSPNANVTREQFATMLYRYGSFQGYDVSDGVMLVGLEDYNQISSFAMDAISWAFGMGILSGVRTADGRLYMQPKNSATRAEVAVMLMRFMEAYGPMVVRWRGLQMTLPEYWRYNYMITEGDNYLSFYCLQEHESSGAGLLCTISLIKPSNWEEIPVKYDVPGGLTMPDGTYYNVVVMYPGGVECLDYITLYFNMRSGITELEDSFWGCDGAYYSYAVG